VTYNDPPMKFEVGTPGIVQQIGMGVALDYVMALGMAEIAAHERALCNYARARLGGLNLTGLKRAGLHRLAIHALRQAYADLFLSGEGLFAERLDLVAEAHADSPEVMTIIAFLRSAERRPVLGAQRDG